MNTSFSSSLESLETRTLLASTSENNEKAIEESPATWAEYFAETATSLSQSFGNGSAMNTKNVLAIPIDAAKMINPVFKAKHSNYFAAQGWGTTTVDFVSAGVEGWDAYNAYSTAMTRMAEVCPKATAGLVSYEAACAIENSNANAAFDGIWISALFATYSTAEYLSYFAIESASNSLSSLFPIAAGASLAYISYEQINAILKQSVTHNTATLLSLGSNTSDDTRFGQWADVIAKNSVPAPQTYCGLTEAVMKSVSFLAWGLLGMQSIGNQFGDSFKTKATLTGMLSYWIASGIHQYSLAAQDAGVQSNTQLEDTLNSIHNELVQDGNASKVSNGFELAQTPTGKFLNQLGVSEGDLWKAYTANAASYGMQLLQQKLYVS